MNIKQDLTPLQLLVAEQYEDGEFGHIETAAQAQEVGDTLFAFCVIEAGDAGDKAEFVDLLGRAIRQLQDLRNQFRE